MATTKAQSATQRKLINKIRRVKNSQIKQNRKSQRQTATKTDHSTSTQKFTLPEDQQASSALVRLPAEIIVKILRFSLKLGETITACADDVGDSNVTNTRPSVQLSAQLMRTCQLLFRLGQVILRNENSLRVDCTVGILSFSKFKANVRLRTSGFDISFIFKNAHAKLSDDVILYVLEQQRLDYSLKL